MFDGYVRDHAFWTPRAPAVVTPAGPVAYDRFNADIDRCGAALAEAGIGPTTGVVSVALQQPYLSFVILAALARLGVASSPALDRQAELRVTDYPNSTHPHALQVTREWADAMLARDPVPLPILELDPEALGRVKLSSGTTATPRRVPFSWRRLEIGATTNLRVYGAGKLGTWFPMTGLDSILGFSQTVVAWAQGAAVGAGMSTQQLPGWLEALPEGLVGLTPTLVSELLTALPPGFQPKPAWRLVVTGAVLPPAVAREAALRITPDIRVVFGSTEASQVAAAQAADLADPPGAAGWTPQGLVVEIRGDDGRPVPPGEPGEICVAGVRVAPGYLDDAEASAERFQDGWYRTRDIGRRLPDGRLAFEGRVDERMNLGGKKFMPGVLEGPALACPGVLDAAAFAVPGPDGIDRCWLAVVTAPGFDRDSLARHLAAYDGLPPNRFAWTGEIPRNAMGKVERTKLRDAVLAATRSDSPTGEG